MTPLSRKFLRTIQEAIGSGVIFIVSCPRCHRTFHKRNWTSTRTRRWCFNCKSPLKIEDGKVVE